MDFDVAGVAVSALIVALVQAYKMFTGERLHKYAPLVAILLGFVFAWLSVPSGQNVDFKDVIINGLIVGLISSGLYSQTKSLIIDDPSTKKELQ